MSNTHQADDVQEQIPFHEDEGQIPFHAGAMVWTFSRLLERAKRQAFNEARTKYYLELDRQHLITDNGDKSGSDNLMHNIDRKLIHAEHEVVSARINLLLQLANLKSPMLPPHVDQSELHATPNIAVHYEQTSIKDSSTMVLRWSTPLMWRLLDYLFDKSSDVAKVSEVLKMTIQSIGKSARVSWAGRIYPLRRCILKMFEGERDVKFHRVNTTDHLREFESNIENLHVKVTVDTLPLPRAELWHNDRINQFVHEVIKQEGAKGINSNEMQQPPHPCTTTKIVITDHTYGRVHTMTLHAFRNPDINQVTHIISQGSVQRGILDTDSGAGEWRPHVPRDMVVLKNNHYRTESRRYIETELNSLHSQGLLFFSDNMQSIVNPGETSQVRGKSARISSDTHDILVSSIEDTESGIVRTVISIVTYPLHGLHYPQIHRPVCWRPPSRRHCQNQGARQPRQRGKAVTGRTNATRRPIGVQPMDNPMLPPAGRFATLQWHSADAGSTHCIFLVEFNEERPMTRDFETVNKSFNKRLLSIFGKVYRQNWGMTKNIKGVKEEVEQGDRKMTMLDFYRDEWYEFIFSKIMRLRETNDDDEEVWRKKLIGDEELLQTDKDDQITKGEAQDRPYLYCSSNEAWTDLANMFREKNGDAHLSGNIFQDYKQYMKLRHEEDVKDRTKNWADWVKYADESVEKTGKDSDKEAPKMDSELNGGVYCPLIQPTGPRPVSFDSPPALLAMVHELRERIEGMQADRERMEGNHEHILHQVSRSIAELKRDARGW